MRGRFIVAYQTGREEPNVRKDTGIPVPVSRKQHAPLSNDGIDGQAQGLAHGPRFKTVQVEAGTRTGFHMCLGAEPTPRCTRVPCPPSFRGPSSGGVV
jgi:hypothetical protein